MKKFNIVGAFDRHNYGDILFPLIHTQFIRKYEKNDFVIEYYSITKSDLTKCGGLKTKTVKSLLKSSVGIDERIIMSGGDILAAAWPLMMGHVSSRYFHLFFKIINKLIGPKFSNVIIKKIYGQINDFPYIISKKDINAKIYYTCVGGSGFNPKNDSFHLIPVTDELKKTEYISVRDKDTKKILEKSGVNCKLTPDSALIMSDFYPKHELGQTDWMDQIEKTNDFDFENYIVFQSGRAFIENNINDVVEQLDKISKGKKLSILLLPIGRATGHEDHVVLADIFFKLKEKKIPVAFQYSNHVVDIMASLAFEKAYIGTSLHGAISSYSFGNKVCGFSTSIVKKLSSFLETWMSPEDFKVVNDFYFIEQFNELIDNGYTVLNKDNLEKQKKMIYNDLECYL